MSKLEKNRSKTGGRKKGTPNKTTALLKDAILKAASLAHEDGLVGYLKYQATLNPGPFMALLGKILPTQMTNEDGGPLKVELVSFADNSPPK